MLKEKLKGEEPDQRADRRVYRLSRLTATSEYFQLDFLEFLGDNVLELEVFEVVFELNGIVVVKTISS
ncbi:hypothetical protein H5410_046203 [Solanum commersonii]|uniref:RNase III domain-containing protein n=1 Tax=Solanum commersonii TaxID=4109 RepID=A0A9J5XBM6_SOLCO|nr:hypothetical protein H5410_046203 [Solanum commersonii]